MGGGDQGWVTQVEAARRLGCSTGKVKALLDAGELERRPQLRDRGTPSVSAASVARMATVLAQQRRQADARRRHLAAWRRPPDDDHVWLDTDETAAVVGLTSVWVKRRAREGRIPATKAGGKWWVRREHAEQIAAARAAARRLQPQKSGSASRLLVHLPSE